VGALEDQIAGPFRKERGDLVNHIEGGTFGQESSPEGGGVDIVEASFDVEKRSGDPESGCLGGPDFVCQREAGIRGAKAWE